MNMTTAQRRRKHLQAERARQRRIRTQLVTAAQSTRDDFDLLRRSDLTTNARPTGRNVPRSTSSPEAIRSPELAREIAASKFINEK